MGPLGWIGIVLIAAGAALVLLIFEQQRKAAESAGVKTADEKKSPLEAITEIVKALTEWLKVFPEVYRPGFGLMTYGIVLVVLDVTLV